MEDDLEALLSAGAPFDITPTSGPRSEPLQLPAPSGRLSPEEVFARAYVRNGNDAAAAVRKAGLQDPRYDMEYVVRGLLSRSDVQAYIEQAQDMVAADRDVGRYTREYFLHGLQEVREKSMDANQFASAISATKLQAQLLGMLEQTVNVNHSMTPRELSLADLRAMVSKHAVIEGEMRVIGDGGE